jgi:GTP-binding protein Era
VVISATIVVEREGQRAIILGHKGEMIREIGTRARAEISDLLQRPAHLKLHIKVHPEWTTSPEALALYGYTTP